METDPRTEDHSAEMDDKLGDLEDNLQDARHKRDRNEAADGPASAAEGREDEGKQDGDVTDEGAAPLDPG